MKMKWKRILFVLAFAMTFAMGGMTGKALAADLAVNEQNFPSEWLRNLMKTPLYDVNGDGILSEQEIQNITCLTNASCKLKGKDTLAVSPLYSDYLYYDKIISGNDLTGKELADTRGLEHLTACQKLALAGVSCNKLVIDHMPQSLQEIYLTDSVIDTLQVSGEGLDRLSFPGFYEEDLSTGWGPYYVETEYGVEEVARVASGVAVTKVNHLDVSGCPGLRGLYCDSPTLNTLDVSKNTELLTLQCNGNQLRELDLSQNKKLTNLGCGHNQLTQLDLSQNTQLEIVNCSFNQLTTLNIRQNKGLMALDASFNRLLQLDISRHPSLSSVKCGNNKLAKLICTTKSPVTLLDVHNNSLKTLNLSKMTKLRNLQAAGNRLKRLDLRRNKRLLWLSCRNNKITKISLPDADIWTKGYNEQLSSESNYYRSLFDGNPIRVADLSQSRNFKTIHKKNIINLMNGKYFWWYDIETGRYIRRETKKPVKKIIASKKLAVKDRNWLKRQAKKYGVKVVYR